MADAYLNTLIKNRREITARGQECCICLEEYPPEPLVHILNEPCIRLPCTHIVHIDCLAQWVFCDENRTATCPMCRHVLFTTAVSPSTEAAARRELQLFYGTGQLLQRGVNGHPDLYDEGQTYPERLHAADYRPLTDPKEFFARRMMILNVNDPPRSTREAMVIRHRDAVEVATYQRLREWDPHMPPLLSSATHLYRRDVDALYAALATLGVFEDMWGPRPEDPKLPTHHDMFMLIRDSGYAYQWRAGHRHNCFRRCGLRRPGRERGTERLSAEARALLEREPLPLPHIRETVREERRGGGGRSDLEVVVAPAQRRQPSPARRVVHWYRRHWWRGAAGERE